MKQSNAKHHRLHVDHRELRVKKGLPRMKGGLYQQVPSLYRVLRRQPWQSVEYPYELEDRAQKSGIKRNSIHQLQKLLLLLCYISVLKPRRGNKKGKVLQNLHK